MYCNMKRYSLCTEARFSHFGLHAYSLTIPKLSYCHWWPVHIHWPAYNSYYEFLSVVSTFPLAVSNNKQWIMCSIIIC